MLIDILPTVILRCGHLPPVPRALASLAAGVGSDAGADAAHRARADYLGAVRHVHAAHRGGQRCQCLVAHGPRRADAPHDVGYVGDVSHAFNAWGGAKVKK